MNVFIDYKLNNTGKGNFLRRLIPELDAIDVKCKFRPKNCDVALGIVYWNIDVKMPKVLRVDGIHLQGKNEKIKNAIKSSDLTIFQSHFARRYICNKLIVPNKCVVIYNGARFSDYVLPPDAGYNGMYLMAARWGNRKHKRLDLHIDYAMARPYETFYIAGEIKKSLPENMIKLGNLKPKELSKWQASCSTLIYLADLDWCPNTVIESRVAGMNIIYNEKCEAVREIMQAPLNDLLIENTAKKYKEAFENALRR